MSTFISFPTTFLHQKYYFSRTLISFSLLPWLCENIEQVQCTYLCFNLYHHKTIFINEDITEPQIKPALLKRNSQGTLFLFITLACFPFPFFQKALLPHTVRLLPPLSLHPSWWLLEDCAHDAPCVYVLRFMKELQKMMCC